MTNNYSAVSGVSKSDLPPVCGGGNGREAGLTLHKLGTFGYRAVVLLFALVTSLLFISCNKAEPVVIKQMAVNLDVSSCFDHQKWKEDGLCGPGVEERLVGGTAACMAWKTPSNEGLLKFAFNQEEGTLQFVEGDPVEIIKGEAIDVKLFMLQPGLPPSRCIPDHFTVDTVCGERGRNSSCLFAFKKVSIPSVDDGVIPIQLGMGGEACGIECNDWCDSDGCTRICWNEEFGYEEVCDGMDNNCDGQIDNVPGLGGDCDTGLEGVCSAGVLVCKPGVDTAMICEPINKPSDELCDGQDNDCDGLVDNVPGLGEPCSTGLHGPCAAGVLTCDGAGEDGIPVCLQLVEPEEEICDGIDNNCDGLVDAEDDTMALPLCENQEGVCRGSVKSRNLCVDGSWQECTFADYEAHAPGVYGVEVCDGLDNLCTGEIDQVEGIGDPCDTGNLGVCAVGTLVCDPAQGPGLICVQNVQPSPEVCDGQDNNCDGYIDNIDGIGVECDTGFEGVCGPGTMQCVPDQGPGLTCIANHTNEAEVCDGIDNDCDGIIDNVIGRGDDCELDHLYGICAVGNLDCVEGMGEDMVCVQVNFPEEEVCDGQDNDCDGIIDNIAEQGMHCSTGLAGVCADGELHCVDGQGPDPVCLMVTGQSMEICDGLDNDCNGIIDDVEGVGEECDTGMIGECARGVMACVEGEGPMPVCEQLYYPTEEQCDGFDNDCDGIIDNVPGLGEECDTGLLGVCSVGILTCFPEDSPIPVCVPLHSPSPEVCDGQDNDCNGLIDDVEGANEDCDTGELGVCAAGKMVCPPDDSPDLVCVRRVEPSDEICDGQDNDCNGVIDDVANLGQVCDTGLVGQCGVGEYSCDGVVDGPAVCKQVHFALDREICNGLDNTCNGLIGAEDPSLRLEPCEKQVGVCRGAMKNVTHCVDGAWRECDEDDYQLHSGGLYSHGDYDHQCDNLDNNCDGIVDNIEKTSCLIKVHKGGSLCIMETEGNNYCERGGNVSEMRCEAGIRVMDPKDLDCGEVVRASKATYVDGGTGRLRVADMNVPRIVREPVTGIESFLLEGARTNYIHYSMDLSESTMWARDHAVVKEAQSAPTPAMPSANLGKAYEVTFWSPVVITQSPTNVNGWEGQGAQFTVTATGTELQYQWEHGTGGAFSEMPGETNSTLSLNSLNSTMNGRQYRCRVYNDFGEAISNPATLAVKGPPVITRNPTGGSTTVGTIFGMSVGATGSELYYRWQFRRGGSSWTAISYYSYYIYLWSSSGSSVYMVGEIAGTYSIRCVVYNEAGDVASGETTVVINAPPPDPDPAPGFGFGANNQQFQAFRPAVEEYPGEEMLLEEDEDGGLWVEEELDDDYYFDDQDGQPLFGSSNPANLEQTITDGGSGNYVLSFYYKEAGTPTTEYLLAGLNQPEATPLDPSSASEWAYFTKVYNNTVPTKLVFKEGDEDPNSTNQVLLYGPQLEAGSFITSYIPTPEGKTETRAEDKISYDGGLFSKPSDAVPYDGSGTYMAWMRPQYKSNSGDLSDYPLLVEDRGGQEKVLVGFKPNASGNSGRFWCTVGGNTVNSPLFQFVTGDHPWMFVACTWGNNGMSMYVSASADDETLPAPESHGRKSLLSTNMAGIKYRPLPIFAWSRDVRLYRRALSGDEIGEIFEETQSEYRISDN